MNDTKYLTKGGGIMKLDTIKFNRMIANNVMSIGELSEVSGISRITIARMRSGKQEPRPQTLGKICKALGCKAEDLIED